MEHSAKQIIRGKILEREKLDVSWSKEWVWSRIETPPQRKKSIFWYAAAVIIGSALSGYLYWNSLSFENNMMVQLDKLELVIEQLTASTTTSPTEITESVCAEEVPTPVSRTPTNKTLVKREHRQNQITATTDSDADPVTHSIDNIPLTIAASIAEPKLIVVEPERMIKPIIGKIPEPQPSLAVAKSKDLKIRVFQARNTQENSVVDNREYKLLTARFNDN